MGSVPKDVYYDMLRQIEVKILASERETENLIQEYSDLLREARNAYPECEAA